MNRRLTGRAIAAGATVLVLAGGGVAYAATSGSETTGRSHGTTGRAAQGEHRLGRGGPGGPGFGPGGPGGPGIGVGGPELLRSAADYLGLTEEELRTRLQDDRSLADVASAEGRDVDGLKAALLAAAKARLDRAVDDGWLGTRGRDELLDGLSERIDELVSSTMPAPPAFGRRGPRGDHGPGGWGPGGRCAPGGRVGRAERSDGAGRPDRAERGAPGDDGAE